MQTPVRVLLVESDDIDARNVARRLRVWPGVEFSIDRANSLARLARVWRAGYDIVLVSLDLPDSRGLDTLREVVLRCHDVPVVVLVNEDDEELGVQAVREGAQDCVDKSDSGSIGRVVRFALERYRFTRKVRVAAVSDELTGLPNRALFNDRVQSALRRATRNDDGVAVLYMDLDGFKPVNDLYGHAIGDLVLRKVAARLRRRLRAADTVARIGGDEFACVLEGATSAASAIQVAEKLREELVREIVVRNRSSEHRFSLHVDVSIGVALYPEHGLDAATLIKFADKAMYQSKNDPAHFVSVYDPTRITGAMGAVPGASASGDYEITETLAFEGSG